MPKKRPPEKTRPRWNWPDGWRAAAWAVLCAEAILAGGDRPCMPTFDPSILLGQMLLFHMLGEAEILGLCAAVPAFVVAANPWSLGTDTRRRIVTTIAVTVIALTLMLFFSNNPFAWLPEFGVVTGLLIRWSPWVRSNWIVVALVSAVALGVIQFSGLQYGQDNCWP